MNFTGGRLVLFLVTAGTAAGIWVIHDSQKTEREVIYHFKQLQFPVTKLFAAGCGVLTGYRWLRLCSFVFLFLAGHRSRLACRICTKEYFAMTSCTNRS